MGKENPKVEMQAIKKVETQAIKIDLAQVKDVEDFKKTLKDQGIPDDIVSEIVSEMPDFIKNTIGTGKRPGLAEMAGFMGGRSKPAPSNSNKTDKTDKTDKEEKPKTGMFKVLDKLEKVYGVSSTAGDRSIAGAAMLSPKERTKKRPFEEIFSILEEFASAPLPTAKRNELKGAFAGQNKISIEDAVMYMADEAGAPVQIKTLMEHTGRLVDILETLEKGGKPDKEQLKAVSNAFDDLLKSNGVKTDNTDNTDNTDKEVCPGCGEVHEEVHEEDGIDPDELASLDEDGRYVVEDMIVQKAGTELFFKVLRAEKSGDLTLAPVQDCVISEERIEIEGKNFNDFLRDYRCIWDPRFNEYSMDGTNPNSIKH